MSTNQPTLPILSCPSCGSTGVKGFASCKICHGLAMGRITRGHWLYWGYPLTTYNLALRSGRRILNKIRLITFFVLGLNFWIWSGFMLYRTGAYDFLLAGPSAWPYFFASFKATTLFLFALGLICFLYLWSVAIRSDKTKGEMEKHSYKETKPAPDKTAGDWEEVWKISRKKRLDIAATFTDEALNAISDAFWLSDKANDTALAPWHVLASLLNYSRIQNIFIRLGISGSDLKQAIFKINSKPAIAQIKTKTAIAISDELKQLLFRAYEEAFDNHQEYVSVTELLLAAVKLTPEAENILADFEIDETKLNNVVEWARVREHLYRQYKKLRRASARRPKSGMDRAMTAVATPYLNRFSTDLTRQSQLGYLPECLARENEIEEIFQAIEGGRQNVLLAGEFGVGKLSIVEGLAERMVEDDVPDILKDKRLVSLSVSNLLSGVTPADAIERLRGITNEIGRAGNIILFIHNIHELIGVSAGTGAGSLDVASALSELLRDSRFIVIASTTPEEYAQHLANTALANNFTRIDIKEMEVNQAIQVLEAKAGHAEYKHQVFFAYDAIAKAVQLSAKFLRDICLPGSALEVMNEAAILAKNKKGPHALVTMEEVGAVVSEKTKIPLTSVTSNESEKLMRLEEEMHQRVIGQDEAVEMVANALRRARAEIRTTTKTIANFLFLGPTGVGKTELAKTIAEVYFGGENRMTRIDMSEYQDKSSIYRLIGAPGQKGTGILTEAVKHAPFSLLLLDEIEKADPDVLNIFLQVMDDGRLTDSAGHMVDFTNVILIATSNAGTSYVQEQMRAGLSSEAIKERLIHGELKEYFRPEFLNRFDGIVLFKALTMENVKIIAGLMLKRVARDLEAKGIQLVVEDGALNLISQAGYDPEFGARPLRRAIQEKVENKLAELLLSGQLKRRDKVTIGNDGVIKMQ